MWNERERQRADEYMQINDRINRAVESLDVLKSMRLGSNHIGWLHLSRNTYKTELLQALQTVHLEDYEEAFQRKEIALRIPSFANLKLPRPLTWGLAGTPFSGKTSTLRFIGQVLTDLQGDYDFEYEIVPEFGADTELLAQLKADYPEVTRKNLAHINAVLEARKILAYLEGRVILAKRMEERGIRPGAGVLVIDRDPAFDLVGMKLGLDLSRPQMEYEGVGPIYEHNPTHAMRAMNYDRAYELRREMDMVTLLLRELPDIQASRVAQGLAPAGFMTNEETFEMMQ